MLLTRCCVLPRLIQVNVSDVCSGTTWAAFTLRWGNITSAFSTSRKRCKRTTTPVHSWGTAATANVSLVWWYALKLFLSGIHHHHVYVLFHVGDESLFLCPPAKKFTGIPMCALLANKRYELLYNCGIQLLHIGRPLAAFECLMEAVQVYHSNPRLWLRLAECCISANKGVGLQFSFGFLCKLIYWIFILAYSKDYLLSFCKGR